MNLILQKLGIVTLVLLFSSALSLAAKAKDPPICVPGDTKCLNPEQPLKERDMDSRGTPGDVKATLVDDDDFWDKVEEEREDLEEEHEDYHDRHYDRDIEIDLDD